MISENEMNRDTKDMDLAIEEISKQIELIEKIRDHREFLTVDSSKFMKSYMELVGFAFIILMGAIYHANYMS